MINSHCHLNDAQFDNDREQVINNFLRAGGDAAICVAWDIESSKKAQQIAETHNEIYYSIGVHPDNVEDFNEKELENLIISSLNNKEKSHQNVIAKRSYHKNAVAISTKNGFNSEQSAEISKLVAIGEIGLDYFHNKENKAEQKRVFIKQIELANKYQLPIIIHCREAYGDTLEILKQFAPFKFGAVMHCYSGSLEYANELIKLGIKISFTGTVTYKNAVNVKEVAKTIPLNSFFLETDCPYLAPVPHRGKRNEPAYVKYVAECIAALRNMSVTDLISATDQNAIKFFNLK